MLFSQFDSSEDKMYQIIDDDGKVLDKNWSQKQRDKELLKSYKLMLLARRADLKAVSYQRQGRMFTFPPNMGQEAIAVASGAVTEDKDWLVPAFRELAAYLAKGVSLKEFYLYFRGHEDASKFVKAKNILPLSVPIASQLPHAVGIAYATRYKKEDSVVFVYVGDGGTSEGDFHEALNFASVWKVPVVFIVQNNQFAISVPFAKQSNSINIAVKSKAYGIPGLKVDGNDFFAMYDALSEAKEYAKSGEGPYLIEALTFRAGAHTTSDDPSRYRTKEEEEFWQKKDPLIRFKGYLMEKGIWSDKEEDKLLEEYDAEIDKQFEEAENYPPYKLEDVFDYLYAEKPEDLKRQQISYEKYLNWKEARK